MRYKDEIRIAFMALAFSCAMFAVYAIVPKDAAVAAKAKATVKEAPETAAEAEALRSSQEDAGFNIIGKKMTILGTGGAAASIIAQAALDGVSAIDVIARKGHSWGETEKVVNRVNAATNCKIQMFELADEVQMRKSIGESGILVNASSVGMSPHEDGCLVPDPGFLHPELIVSDVIYNPRKTKLLSMAESVGCPFFNGMYMLLYQGAYAFTLWTGKEMPVGLVKEKYFT